MFGGKTLHRFSSRNPGDPVLAESVGMQQGSPCSAVTQGSELDGILLDPIRNSNSLKPAVIRKKIRFLPLQCCRARGKGDA